LKSLIISINGFLNRAIDVKHDYRKRPFAAFFCIPTSAIKPDTRQMYFHVSDLPRWLV